VCCAPMLIPFVFVLVLMLTNVWWRFPDDVCLPVLSCGPDDVC